jgi:hypothetical protein
MNIHAAVGWIEGDPTGLGQVDLGPRVRRIRLPVGGVGSEDITGGGPGAETQMARCFDEQCSHVPAGAARHRQSLGPRLDAFFVSGPISHVGENAGVQVLEQ